jgi:hypothetical protein
MNHRGMSVSSRHSRMPVLGAAACLLLAISACTAGKPTQVVVHVTLPPATATATATPTEPTGPTDTPSTTATPTSTASGSPTASGSALPSGSPAASPTGPAGGCLGTQDNQDFFALAANKLTFAVYCATPRSGWYVNGGTYTQPNGGTLNVAYKGSGGATLALKEGAFCTTSAAACSTHIGGSLGSASFGDLTGTLYAIAGGGYAIYVAPGTAHGYTAIGTNVTQGTFVSIVSALIRVPKS